MPTQGHPSRACRTSSRPLDRAPAGRRLPPASIRAGTLRLRVEVRRQWRRRRTQLTLGFLVLLPFLLVGAFKLGSGRPGRGAPGLVDLATTGAANFTLFTLFVATGFLLVVVFALFAGDSVASEASWSSLRYLLAAPVPRSRLLRQKLMVGLGFSLFALVLLPAVAYLVGGVFFGWAPARTPLGTTFGAGAALVRLAVVVGYLAVTLLFVVRAGVPARGVDGRAAGSRRRGGAAGDRVQHPGRGDGAGELAAGAADALLVLVDRCRSPRRSAGTPWPAGRSGRLTYTVVLLALAWWHFLRKDIVS